MCFGSLDALDLCGAQCGVYLIWPEPQLHWPNECDIQTRAVPQGRRLDCAELLDSKLGEYGQMARNFCNDGSLDLATLPPRVFVDHLGAIEPKMPADIARDVVLPFRGQLIM